MNTQPASAVDVDRVTHRYGGRMALSGLSLHVAPAEIFAILGPNGGGKTTLFRLLSTLIPLQDGEISVLGHSVTADPHGVRRQLGVVFQAPSLDKKLTVAENLLHQGHLYGMRGARLANRSQDLLNRFGLADRAHELTETLSGGLRRRVELAKGLLHQPRVLLLDEPSTGLDPGARRDVWQQLEQLRTQLGVTVVFTTHLLEEADKADRIAIIDGGVMVAEGAPDALRAEVGGDSITIDADEPAQLAAAISERWQCAARVLDGAVRLERPDGHQWVARLVEAFPGRIRSVRLGKPSLEDVFIARTGHRFWQPTEGDAHG